jgi:LuxR family maltose regulon positive regulatory protein
VEFLVRTSVLDEFTAPLCDAITGRHDSQRLLHWLESQNLFLVRLDEQAEWFRYHHLFAELLRAELRAADPRAEPDIHHRAAEWFTQHDRISHAINQLLLGRFYNEALELILTHAVRFYHEGQRLAVARFLELLPEEMFQEQTRLMVDRAAVLVVAGRYGEAEAWLQKAERVLGDNTGADAVQWARLNAIGASLAQLQGDGPSTIRRGTAAMEEWCPEADDGEGATLPYSLIRAWGWLDDTRAAWSALRRDRPTPPLVAPLSEIVPPATLSQICYIEGRLRDATRLADEALDNGVRAGLDHPALGEARLTRAGVLWERNQLGSAETEFELALRSAESDKRVGFVVLAALGLARIWQTTGRQDDAFDMLAVARQASGGHLLPAPFGTRVNAVETQMLIDVGSLAEARILLGRLPESIQLSLLTARLSLAEGDRSPAAELISLVDRGSLTLRQELECWLLDTCSGSPTAAGSLTRALQFAAHERYIRCFVGAGDAMKDALRHRRAGEDAPFVRELLSAIGETAVPRVASSDNLREPLTEREEAVLAFLPGWLSNREIAAELYVSVNTLKTHLKSLYRKLEATSRHDAVVRSKALGLL